MRDGLPHIRAARWVIRLGRVFWGLAVLAAASSLLAALFTGSWAALVVPVLLAGYATAWGALVRAFEAHRRGAWRLLLGLTALGLLGTAADWLGGRPVSVLVLAAAVLHAAYLGLLLHRDSREWVGADGPRGVVGAGTGGHPGGRH
jgi:hypothetical protein